MPNILIDRELSIRILRLPSGSYAIDFHGARGSGMTLAKAFRDLATDLERQALSGLLLVNNN